MRQRSDRRSAPAPRTEPVLGRLDALPADRTEAPPRRRARPAKKPVRWGWLVALLLLVGGGLWAWSERDALRGLLPDTQLNDILARADSALDAGKLVGSDGSSARELYSAARALAPDNERALDGLQKVGKAEFERAQKTFAEGKLDDAGRALEQARALLGGGSELDKLAADIAATRARGTQLDSLLDRARQAQADGRIDGDGGAAALYRQMLLADPGNAVAQHGLDGIGRDLARDVRKALSAGDLATAKQGLQQLAGLLPDYGALPGLRADVAQAQAKLDAQRAALLKQADADLAAGRIDGNGEDNALARYRAVLGIDADDADAHAGLRKVAAALLQRADAAVTAGQFDAAEATLATATSLAPDSVQLADARARLRAARKAPSPTADAAADAAPPATLSAADRAKVQSLLTRAQAAAADGDLMLPPGDCAYDLYRSALAIDAGNADALAGLATLPSTARSLFDQAIAGDKPDRAAGFMESFAALAPGSAALPALRGKLAGAWIERASQRADAGDLGEARRALGKARQLAPDDARLAALAQRLGG